MSVNWNYYNDPKFDAVDAKYLPVRGEGETMASQIVTAVNKLVYKWYNDGDVFDNRYWLKGWCNDLSSYANWLFRYAELDELLEIRTIESDGEYEDLLKEVADKCCDMEFLAQYEVPKRGSVYKCAGPFEYGEPDEDDDDDYYEDEWEDDEDEEEDA